MGRFNCCNQEVLHSFTSASPTECLCARFESRCDLTLYIICEMELIWELRKCPVQNIITARGPQHLFCYSAPHSLAKGKLMAQLCVA